MACEIPRSNQVWFITMLWSKDQIAKNKNTQKTKLLVVLYSIQIQNTNIETQLKNMQENKL